MLYDKTLQPGTSIYSLHPEKGPYDSGKIPEGHTVHLVGVDHGVPGDFLYGRVDKIIKEVAVYQHSMGEREGVWADLGNAVEVRREALSLEQVDCGGMMVFTGLSVYFKR